MIIYLPKWFGLFMKREIEPEPEFDIVKSPKRGGYSLYFDLPKTTKEIRE